MAQSPNWPGHVQVRPLHEAAAISVEPNVEPFWRFSVCGCMYVHIYIYRESI